MIVVATLETRAYVVNLRLGSRYRPTNIAGAPLPLPEELVLCLAEFLSVCRGAAHFLENRHRKRRTKKPRGR